MTSDIATQGMHSSDLNALWNRLVLNAVSATWGYITAPHFSRLLRHAWGYGGHILDLNPGSPRGRTRLSRCYIKYMTRCGL